MNNYLELKAQLATLDLKLDFALAAEKAKAIRQPQARMTKAEAERDDLNMRKRRADGRRTKSQRYPSEPVAD